MVSGGEIYGGKNIQKAELFIESRHRFKSRSEVIAVIAGDFFVTPHAVRQFQSRIAPWMSYEQALGAIIRELRDAGEPRTTMNGRAYYIRTNGEWQFRAVIREGEIQPAVVTILRSGKGGKRRNRTGAGCREETASAVGANPKWA